MQGKTALVTGSSRGIGKAIALEFARNGAKVIVNYKKNELEARKVLEEIKQISGEAIAIKADVSKVKEVEDLFRQVKQKYGSIDVLVNNAGVLKDNLAINVTNEDWDVIINTNLKKRR